MSKQKSNYVTNPEVGTLEHSMRIKRPETVEQVAQQLIIRYVDSREKTRASISGYTQNLDTNTVILAELKLILDDKFIKPVGSSGKLIPTKAGKEFAKAHRN